MAIASRTANSGTVASGASFTPTVPSDAVYGDILILLVAEAGTAAPTPTSGRWNTIGVWSAGSGQSLSAFWTVYRSNTNLSFTNAASAAAYVINAYSGCDTRSPLLAAHRVASNTTANTTLPTGAPITHERLAGSYEVLGYAWTSNATISGVASGSTIDKTQANSTTLSVALGHNNTTSINAGITCTAFSQTLSGTNSLKTGVGIVLNPPRNFSTGYEDEMTDGQGIGVSVNTVDPYDGTFPVLMDGSMKVVDINVSSSSKNSHP